MKRLKLAVCGAALACLACGSLSVDQAPTTKVPSTIPTNVGPAIQISPVDHPAVLPQGGGQNLVGGEQAAPVAMPRVPSGEKQPPPPGFQLPAEPIVRLPCSGGTRMQMMCPVAAP
jgi:hypothetical protein